MRSLLLALAVIGAGYVSAAETPSDAGFAEVGKIFAEHCFDCHGVKDPEGNFVLETYDLLMKGGETGAAIVPGKSSESLLVKMIEGKFQKDGKTKIMPPGKRAKLTPEQISSIRQWIDAGAKSPGENIAFTREIVVPKITPKTEPRSSILSLAYEPKSGAVAMARPGRVDLHSAENQSVIRSLPWADVTINAVCFSPDGTRLFAAGGVAGVRGEIREWKLPEGTLTRTLSAHSDSIYSLAISADGKVLATGSYDQKVKLWNVESGEEARTLSGHNGCIYALSFRPDGKILASASADRTVKLWDVSTGARRDTLSQPLKEQYTVAFSPDGRRLAAAGVDNRIRVWEISDDARETTNPLLHSKFAHDGAVLKVAFSPDGKTLASSGEDKLLKLWKADSMQEQVQFEPQSDWTPALVFARDKALVAGRLDGSLSFYNPRTGAIVPPPKPELARVEPRGIQRGLETKLKLTGKHLDSIKAVHFNNPGIKAEILSGPAATATDLWLNITAEKNVPRAFYDVRLEGRGGESSPLKIYVDDLPQQAESEGAASMLKLPVTVWGSHSDPGDKDTYEFTANEGETVVFDAAARAIGSKADLVLSLLDTEGKVLVTNNKFDKTGDPLIAYTFKRSGKYQLVVGELVLGGSDQHFYRISAGTLPFVTAVYPPVAPKGESTELTLIGYNLPASQTKVLLEPATAETMVPLDSEKFRWRGNFKVAVSDQATIAEREPNNEIAKANVVPVPGIASGQITAGDTQDFYRFSAKAGKTLIVETAADRLGSALDTKIEILDSAGKPVLRTWLQAVRDSAVTFRGIDSSTVDCRVDNWEEMELNQYLYLQGEVVRLFRAPQGPDSGFNFYAVEGRRRNYFDTTATAHANAEPCYIVEPRSPGATLVPNGLPVFPVYFENDDDAERKLGPDSRLYFTAPKDGEYLVRVTDTRGFTGDRFLYTLALRDARPDFKISVEGLNPTIPKGSGQRFVVKADRIDGFEGDIKVEISGLPPGFIASSPVTIEAGHMAAFGTLFAAPDAPPLTADNCSSSKLTATAEINGEVIHRDAGTLGKISLTADAPLFVVLEPASSGIDEITIAPGGTVPARLKIRRHGHNDLVTFQVENLPHGIIVANIGLNGVLIPKDQDQREIFLTAAGWVHETDRLCYAISNEAGRQTSRPVLVKVRKSAGQVAGK